MLKFITLFFCILPFPWLIDYGLNFITGNKLLSALACNLLFTVFLLDCFDDLTWFLITYLTIIIHTTYPSFIPYLIVIKELMYAINHQNINTDNTPYKIMIDIAILSLPFSPSLSYVMLLTIVSCTHNMMINKYHIDNISYSNAIIWSFPVIVHTFLLTFGYEESNIFNLMETVGYFTVWNITFLLTYYFHAASNGIIIIAG